MVDIVDSDTKLLRAFEKDLVTRHWTGKSVGFLLRAFPMVNVKVFRGTLKPHNTSID
jgi:hypothetical protein